MVLHAVEVVCTYETSNRMSRIQSIFLSLDAFIWIKNELQQNG